MPLWTVHWSLVQVIACLCLLGNKHDISNLFAEQWRPNREGALQQNDKWFSHFFFDRFTYSKKIQLSLNCMLWWDKLFSWKWAVITCMWIEIKINAEHTSIKPSYLARGITSTSVMETAGSEVEETLERALEKRWYNTSFFKLAFKVLQMTSVFSKCWGPAAFLNKIYYHWLLPLLALYVVTMLGSRIELVLKKREHYASVCPEQGYAFMPLLLSL